MMQEVRQHLCLPLLLILILLLVVPGVIYAGLLCRSDPKVELSNGVNLNIGFYIDTSLDQISQVRYELHVPVGVSLKKSVKTPGWATNLETFTLVADQALNNYFVTTTVHTHLGNAHIVAYTLSKEGGHSSNQVSGLEGQPLTASFSG